MTAIVSALRAVDRSDPGAMRRCVDALGLALDVLLELEKPAGDDPAEEAYAKGDASTPSTASDRAAFARGRTCR